MSKQPEFILAGIRKNLPEKKDYLWVYKGTDRKPIRMTWDQGQELKKYFENDRAFAVYGVKLIETSYESLKRLDTAEQLQDFCWL